MLAWKKCYGTSIVSYLDCLAHSLLYMRELGIYHRNVSIFKIYHNKISTHFNITKISKSLVIYHYVTPPSLLPLGDSFLPSIGLCFSRAALPAQLSVTLLCVVGDAEPMEDDTLSDPVHPSQK